MDQSPWLKGIFGVYNLGDRTPTLVSYDEVDSQRIAAAPCAVLMQTEQPKAEAAVAAFKRDYPDRQLEELTDLSGSQKVLVVR